MKTKLNVLVVDDINPSDHYGDVSGIIENFIHPDLKIDLIVVPGHSDTLTTELIWRELSSIDEKMVNLLTTKQNPVKIKSRNEISLLQAPVDNIFTKLKEDFQIVEMLYSKIGSFHKDGKEFFRFTFLPNKTMRLNIFDNEAIKTKEAERAKGYFDIYLDAIKILTFNLNECTVRVLSDELTHPSEEELGWLNFESRTPAEIL